MPKLAELNALSREEFTRVVAPSVRAFAVGRGADGGRAPFSIACRSSRRALPDGDESERRGKNGPHSGASGFGQRGAT